MEVKVKHLIFARWEIFFWNEFNCYS